MEKEKVKIRKLMILSPEFYEQIKREPKLPINLLNVEKEFLKIFQEKNLSTSQKLALYNNLFAVSFNNKNHTLHLPSQEKTLDEGKAISKPSESKSSQTEKRLNRESFQTENFVPIASSSPEHSSISQPPKIPTKLPPRTVNNFLDEEFYENVPQVLLNPIKEKINDEIDLSMEKRNFIENVRRASGVNDFDLRDFSFHNLEDPSKDYALVRNKKNEELLTVDKPSSKRKKKSSQNPDFKEKKTKTSPKKLRSGLVRNFKSNDFSSAWATYERNRLREN